MKLSALQAELLHQLKFWMSVQAYSEYRREFFRHGLPLIELIFIVVFLNCINYGCNFAYSSHQNI